MEKFVETVYQKLLNELNAVPELKMGSVKNPLLVGDRVRNCIEELKVHFKENPFADKGQEVLFFKYDKPKIVAEHIYAQELYAVESNKPAGDQSQVDSYYAQELAFIRRAFNKHRYLYQYYQLDGSEFDETYFIRGRLHSEVRLPVGPDFDGGFSTLGDFLFAKFMAFERLQEYITDILYSSSNGKESPEPVHWTGDIINLVELIYGLHLTGQINYGNASLNELVRWAEKQFGVKIGVVQRRFAEIQSRKRLATTKFLDQMRSNIHDKIEKLSA